MPDLITRPIPSTGEQLPAVGLGTWQAFDVAGGGLDYAQAGEALQALVEAGGRLVDSSPMYGRAEARVGDLAAERALRPRLFLATKVWTRGRDDGVQQMRDSFAKLRADVLDLMQVHNLVDVDVHMPTLQAWKAEGRIRYLGLTHYHQGGYEALEAAMRAHPIDAVQVNLSAVEWQAEIRILPLAAELGLAVIVNRPLAGGELARKIRRAALPEWAAELSCSSWSQLLLKYVLAHPAVTCVIPGTRNPAHVRDNLAAALPPLPDPKQRARIADAVKAL
jgi:diketogulonate reductase-like aldo/keto reductase